MVGGILVLFNRTQIIRLDLGERQVMGPGQMTLSKFILTANVHDGGIFTVDKQGSGVVVDRLHRIARTVVYTRCLPGAAVSSGLRAAKSKYSCIFYYPGTKTRARVYIRALHKISHLGGKARASSHQGMAADSSSSNRAEREDAPCRKEGKTEENPPRQTSRQHA